MSGSLLRKFGRGLALVGLELRVRLFGKDLKSTTTAPTDGQVLRYVAADDAWSPGTVSGGGSLPAGALGSVMVHDGLAWVSLGVGTTGQVLRVVSGEPKWVTITAGDVGAIPSPGTPISGGLLYYAGSWQSTTAGSLRQPMLSGGGAIAPAWGADVVPLTQRAIDGLGTSVTVCATIAHDLSGGGGGSGIGARCAMQNRNSGGSLVDTAAIDGVLTTATAGAEVGVLDVRVRGGGSLARVARFAADQLRLDWAARALTLLAGDGVTELDVFRVDGSNYWTFGTTNASNSGGTILYAPASGEVYVYRGATAHWQISSAGATTIGTTAHATTLRGSSLTIGLSSVVAIYQGGARVPETTISSSTTLDASHEVVFVDATAGAVTLTLPAGASGRVLAIQRIAGNNNIVVQRAGSDTIRAGGSGALASWTISDGARHGLIYRSGGTEWVAEA